MGDGIASESEKLTDCLSHWIEKADSDDALRLVSGRPGSGKSTLLRIIAGTGIHELFIAAGLAIVIGAALAMYTAGLSMGLGAFIAGMLVADSEYRHQLETDITPFKSLLLGLFFIAVGMSANLTLLIDMPTTIIGLTLSLIVIKATLLVPMALVYGLNRIFNLTNYTFKCNSKGINRTF